MSCNILFISRDPGGTNQLVGLRDVLLGQDGEDRAALFAQLGLSSGPDITLLAKDYAKVIWQQNGVVYEDWPNIESEQEIIDYLTDLAPDLIVTSTCHVDDRTEQTVWRVARQLGIRTTAFLDCGLNISLRFTDDLGQTVLPDRVYMIDKKATGTLLSLGLPAQDMFISGDLYLTYAKAKGIAKGKLRHEWGVMDEEYLIVFASDYISEMQAMGVSFEITEFDCLNCLLDLMKSGEISKYLEGITGPYRLIIRPHPKDTAGKYDNYPDKSHENLEILISNSGSGADAILSADMVAGLGSSLMGEAKVLGVGVLELGSIVTDGKDHKKTVS